VPLRPLSRRRLALALAAGALLAGCAQLPRGDAGKIARIHHVVVIVAENRSFDHIYGLFPGANGISRATPEQKTQLDHDGTPLPELVIFTLDGKPDARFPKVPNGPFRIDAPPIDRPITELVHSPVHAFFHHVEQVNGGRNNMFAAMSNNGGWTMGYYDGSVMRLWKWAQEYTLADNFFQGAFGGSYLNHHWLVCACTPRYPDAPQRMRVRLDASGKLEKMPGSPSARVGAVQVYSGGGVAVTPDGYTVNTVQPPWQPSGIPPAPTGPATHADPAGTTAFGLPLPPQTARTIGDTLTAKGVDWAWYAGAWNAAVADAVHAPTDRRVIYTRRSNAPNYQPHHQPFNYFARFAPGTPDRARHLKDGEDFVRAIETGTLPPVSFYKPAGIHNQHPAYGELLTGDAHIADLLDKLRASPQWKDMLVVVTYDENGGFWDHVPPPTGPGWADRFGPGSRIPTILVGPTVRRGFIDSTPYDTTSILKFITERFGLEPLPGVRPNAGNLANALN
jgi:acid phosphatase